MKEIRLLIRIDEKTDKIAVVEEVIGIPPGISKQLFLQGVYNYLLFRNSKKFNINDVKWIYIKIWF